MSIPPKRAPLKRTQHRVEHNSPEHFAMRLGWPNSSCFDHILTSKRAEPSRQRKPYMRRLNAENIANEQLEDEEYRSRWMERGQEWEDPSVAAYEMLMDRETSPGGYWTIEIGGGRAGCSPDRLIGEDGVLEIKAPLLSTQVAGALDGVEVNHICQIQGLLWITDRQWLDLFSFHPLLVLPPKRILRDEEFIEKLEEAVKEFIEEMLRERIDLEREHGPFLRMRQEEVGRHG